MNKSISQRVHEYLGNKGLLAKTNCVERGCDKYHGGSPSQSMMFYMYKGLEKGLKEKNKDIVSTFEHDKFIQECEKAILSRKEVSK